MHRFALLVVAVTFLTSSMAQAASYQKTDGTIVDPIIDTGGNPHSYSGNNLEPGANLSSAVLPDANLNFADLTAATLTDADLTFADLIFAGLTNADLTNADLTSADLTSADLRFADLTDADLTNADLTNADLYRAYLTDADLTGANLSGSNISVWHLQAAAGVVGVKVMGNNMTGFDLSNLDLTGATLTNADLSYADLYDTNLNFADLYSANLTDAYNVETSTGSPYYYPNTTLPAGFDPVAQGWTLSPYCDFTPDAACNLADINQMFKAGDLVTGVATSVYTDRLDLVNNDTIDAADITEWLVQAATANGHGSPYLRGDTELDGHVDITDFNTLASSLRSRRSLRTQRMVGGQF